MGLICRILSGFLYKVFDRYFGLDASTRFWEISDGQTYGEPNYTNLKNVPYEWWKRFVRFDFPRFGRSCKTSHGCPRLNSSDRLQAIYCRREGSRTYWGQVAATMLPALQPHSMAWKWSLFVNNKENGNLYLRRLFGAPYCFETLQWRDKFTSFGYIRTYTITRHHICL